MNESEKMMRDECRQKLEFEIRSHETMIDALRARLEELPDMDLHEVVQHNAALSHHNPKVKR